MNLDGHGYCFRSSYLLPLSFVIRGKVSLWHEVAGFRGTCRSRKDVPGRVFGDHPPVSLGTGGSLFPSVRATRSDTTAVRIVNVKLGLDSEKRKPTRYPRSLNRETTFGRRNGLHSFHCMSYALNVSRAFRCPPTFLRANFWWIAPIARSDHWLTSIEGLDCCSTFFFCSRRQEEACAGWFWILFYNDVLVLRKFGISKSQDWSVTRQTRTVSW